MAGTRTLITGAAGFLGGHLLRQLNHLRWDVTGTARQAASPQILSCDITDGARLEEIVSHISPEVIFHLAALTPAAAPNAKAADYLRVNGGGTLALLEAARKCASGPRIVLVTSSAMYGQADAADGVIREDSALRPVHAYGVSKAAQHLFGHQYYEQYNLDVVRVCPFNLTGYALPKGLVASDFARQIVAMERSQQEPIIHVGDLNSKRDFLDVADAVSALVSLVDKGKAGESYNLASSQPIQISDILHDLLSMSKLAIKIQPRPNSMVNRVPIQIGANDKLISATGWQPQIPIKQSLANVLAYWREQ